MKLEDMELYRRALTVWGPGSQIVQLVEEMAELQVELLHYLRGRGSEKRIHEEMADVGIMLDQVGLIFEDIELARQCKLALLKVRIEKAESVDAPFPHEYIDPKQGKVTVYRREEMQPQGSMGV